MGNILDKVHEAEAELENINRELEEKKSLLKAYIKEIKQTETNSEVKPESEDLLCQEAFELYDILDWFHMAFNEDRIVTSNKFFSQTIIKGLNNIYDRGYQNGIDELRDK